MASFIPSCEDTLCSSSLPEPYLGKDRTNMPASHNRVAHYARVHVCLRLAGLSGTLRHGPARQEVAADVRAVHVHALQHHAPLLLLAAQLARGGALPAQPLKHLTTHIWVLYSLAMSPGMEARCRCPYVQVEAR